MSGSLMSEWFSAHGESGYVGHFPWCWRRGLGKRGIYEMKHQIRNPARYYSSVFDFLNVRIIDTIQPLCRYAYTDWIYLYIYNICVYKYVHIGIWFGNSIFMSCISSTARALRRGVPEQDAWPAQSRWKDQAQHAKPEQWHSSYVYQLNKYHPINSFSQCFPCCRDIFVIFWPGEVQKRPTPIFKGLHKASLNFDMNWRDLIDGQVGCSATREIPCMEPLACF